MYFVAIGYGSPLVDRRRGAARTMSGERRLEHPARSGARESPGEKNQIKTGN